MHNSIGIIEVSSVASGFQAQDMMIKTADVELLIARTICSGKYMIAVGGQLSSVQASLEAGKADSAGFLIDSYFLPNIAQEIFPAIYGASTIPEGKDQALGILETFSASTIRSNGSSRD